MLTEGDELSGHDVGERLDDVGQERSARIDSISYYISRHLCRRQ
jgi:hypothetical protein